jgi:hypothetical protein
MFSRWFSRALVPALSSVGLLASPLPAYPKQTPAAPPKKVSKPSKCAVVGTWRGNITIPDGADGIAGPLTLKITGPGNSLKVSGAMNQKALTVSDAKASCTEVSFTTPNGNSPVTFSGKVSDDGGSLSGTAKRQDAPTSWTLQRQ